MWWHQSKKHSEREAVEAGVSLSLRQPLQDNEFAIELSKAEHWAPLTAPLQLSVGDLQTHSIKEVFMYFLKTHFTQVGK